MIPHSKGYIEKILNMVDPLHEQVNEIYGFIDEAIFSHRLKANYMMMEKNDVSPNSSEDDMRSFFLTTFNSSISSEIVILYRFHFNNVSFFFTINSYSGILFQNPKFHVNASRQTGSKN